MESKKINQLLCVIIIMATIAETCQIIFFSVTKSVLYLQLAITFAKLCTVLTMSNIDYEYVITDIEKLDKTTYIEDSQIKFNFLMAAFVVAGFFSIAFTGASVPVTIHAILLQITMAISTFCITYLLVTKIIQKIMFRRPTSQKSE